ncbi:MAG: hypothetical protein ACI9F9_002759, partial [Candidatus Paceibacteria bacterium]
PAGTYSALARRLGLHFNHQPDLAGETSALATSLSADQVSPNAWRARAIARHPDSLAGFAQPMWESLAGAKLSDRQLGQFLDQLQRPDVANLPSLLVRELKLKTSRGFGSLNIHKQLLISQLEDCVSLHPSLLNEPAFIAVYLKRLLPGADADWQEDREARGAYIDRLGRFVRRLSAAHNSLKAYVLQHRLLHDMSIGQPNRERLLEFLRLPRQANYVKPELIQNQRNQDLVRETGQDLAPLGMAGSPEVLLRSYLGHFFLEDESWASFSEYVREDYLRRVFVETKILAGIGDRERWYSLLDDSNLYEQLEARVEINFLPIAKRKFGPDEAVAIDVDIKNVGTLLVKVFEIDAASFARAHGREVDASIDLDGLVAGSETTYTYDDHALLRVRRQFQFPELKRPGIYVIDFIGGGLSSRAVIKKGHLQLRERMGSAGHVLQVLDGSGKALPEASVQVAGHAYTADADGDIHVPFSTEPGSETIILQHGRLVSVAQFQQAAERYTLSAGIHVEREALLAEGLAKVLVRADLHVNGFSAAIELLEDPTLTLVAHDLDGTTTSTDVRGLKLRDGREFVHEFKVPENMLSLSFTLGGHVENLSLGQRQTLSSASMEFQLNAVDSTAETQSSVLERDATGFFVDVLGKNGEPQVGRVVEFQLTHRGFRDTYNVHLQTDDSGRIRLGALDGVERLHVSGFPNHIGDFPLIENRHTRTTELHGLVGHVLRLQYTGKSKELTRQDVSLIELRGDQFTSDRLPHVSLVAGFIELKGLPAGDYDLFLKHSRERVLVRITRGQATEGWAIGAQRMLELQRPQASLRSALWGQAGLEIQLDNPTAQTRVHVFNTRFVPTYDAYANLLPTAGHSLRAREVKPVRSTYNAARQIGDEYRYILERRFAKKYPGNMLQRPGLLLNPWSVNDSTNSIGIGGGMGGRFGGRKGLGKAAGRASGADRQQSFGVHPGTFPNFDFLSASSTSLANLRPDENGRISIPAARLGSGQHLRVLVMDDTSLIQTSIFRKQNALSSRDRRLAGALAPGEHFSEQRRIGTLATGESTALRDSASARVATYATLEDVFQVYRTLQPQSELENFAFLMKWPECSEKEKQNLYSKHACHELHVFLFHKDREFFERVLRPYLANKADKTFVDLWLLEEDLDAFLDPWAFALLNAFEQGLLAQRLERAAAGITRRLADRVESSKMSPSQLVELYRSLLSGNAFESSTQSVALGVGFKANRPLPDPSTARVQDSSGEESLEEVEQEVAEEMNHQDDFFLGTIKNKDAERRSVTRYLFQGLGPTKQYAEHNYWHTRIKDQNALLIRPNEFWLDFARSKQGELFLSPHFAQATRNVSEMMMALAVMDLPFLAKEHQTTRANGQLTLSAGSPLVIVRKELAPATKSDGVTKLLVGQQFFPLKDRYKTEGGVRLERLVTKEFLTGTAYGCRVVLTNPSADSVQLDLLMQIPAGAIPVQGGFRTRGIPVHLEPYATHTTEYGFYFPGKGH